MTDIIQQLKDAEKRVADAKAAVERAEGRREQILATLKKDYGANSLQEGNSILASLKERVAKMEARLEKLVDEINGEIEK